MEAADTDPETNFNSVKISSTRRPHSQDEEEMESSGDMKKRRMPAGQDIGPKLVNMIKKLDEDLNGATVENAIEELANVLEENLDPYEGQIIHILYECAAYLPEKITIFSTLVGILNSRSSDFGERLILKFFDELHDTFSRENYDITIRIVTFLCDLGNSYVVNLNSILDFLDNFVDLAVEENVKSDFFVYCVLHALPWIGTQLHEKMAQRFYEMLDRIALYLAKRKKDHTKMLQVWSSSELSQDDYLDSLWAQLQKLREADWFEKHILRIYIYFTQTLQESTLHEFPPIDRSILENSKNHPLPRVTFRLFQQSDCPDPDAELHLPPGDSIERFLVEEDLNWIIDNNYTNWKLCAQALLNYHRRETVPLNYVVIEAIFGQLFRLPKSPHIEIFYGALLIELCRSQANSLPQVLALAAEMLFQRTDSMQPICIDRFADWFSYHLSNFEYRWSWGDWAECVELESLHPKRIFVREVIEKCMRLSYHKKLSEFLPREFAPIIPDEPIINYGLDDERHSAYDQAEQFKELIMRKGSDDDILAMLEVHPTEQLGEEEEEQKVVRMEQKMYSSDSVVVFFAVLLKLASKTLTHSFAALTRYHKTLTALTTNNEQMQSLILRTLYDSWSHSQQMMTVLVDKMVKMRILDPAVVQAWVFSDEMKVEFKRSWVWDVLSAALIHLERQRNKFVRDRDSCTIRLERLSGQKNVYEEAAPTVKSERQNEQNQEMEQMVTDVANGNNENESRPRITAPNDEQMDIDGELAVREGDVRDMNMGRAGAMNLDERIAKVNEQLEKVTADLEITEKTLRIVLLNICHKFTLILTEHLVNCETEGTAVENNFYNFVIGRFNYVFLKHADSMWKFATDLEQELFSSPTIEPRIRRIFEQFISLRH